jgi:hypothetical protein
MIDHNMNDPSKSVADMGPEIWERPLVYLLKPWFFLNNKNLNSLSGSPQVIYGCIDLNNNPLLSWAGGPTEVRGCIDANACKFTSLVGCPTIIDGWFDIDHNPITTLDGIPERINGMLFLSNTLLTTLHGINKLKSMSGCIMLNRTAIQSHIMGVFFIKGCTGIDTNEYDTSFAKAAEVVNRHIIKGRSGLLACTQELIKAGLADFAQI